MMTESRKARPNKSGMTQCAVMAMPSAVTTEARRAKRAAVAAALRRSASSSRCRR